MSKSDILFNQACEHIPGGVNSPVRAFKGVGGTPVFFKRGKGAYLYDADEQQYIDYVASWGPMIVGHANEEVLAAIQKVMQDGLSFGAPTELEIQMANKVCEVMPGMDLVRMVNSGTEATMSAIRLARGYTGRDKLLKFEGCYHGHADSLLVKAGSGALTLGEPTSPGVPADLAQHTITLEYNNAEQVRELFSQLGEQLACVIVEPVAGNMNCIPPEPGFLQTLRDCCDQYGAVLIFDEVMTGFRVGLQGAQGHFNIQPDLTTLGKVIGGGMPVGAFGGKREIMEHIAPLGPVYQAGTLSGNPLAMAAGLKNLELICQPGFYEPIFEATSSLCQGLEKAAAQAGVPLTTNHIGTMFGFFFTEEPEVSRFSQVSACNQQQFQRFYHEMLNRGVYLAPSSFEAGFVGSCHTNKLIEQTIHIAEQAFTALS